MNTIEKLRMETGLTRPQMLRALEAKPGRFTLFTADDSTVDRIFITRAKRIRRQYDEWVNDLIRRLTAYKGHTMTPSQVARTIAPYGGFSEFNLVQMRARNLVTGVQVSPRNWGYRIEHVLALIKRNGEYMFEDPNHNRGPLANAFEAWLEAAAAKESSKVAV